MGKEYEFWQKCVEEWEKENGDIDNPEKVMEVQLYAIRKAYEKGKNDKTYNYGH